MAFLWWLSCAGGGTADGRALNETGFR